MAELFNILVACPRCRGVGSWEKEQMTGDPIAVDPCDFCSGAKYLQLSKIDLTDIVDKLNDILDKCNDIFEQLTE